MHGLTVSEFLLFYALYQQEHALLIEEIRRAKERIKHMACYDLLTGFPNFAQARDRIKQLLVETHHSDHQGAILLVDLDNFKNVNSLMGNYYGDLILQQVAIRIAKKLRKNDIVARKNGDEFIVVFSEISSVDVAAHMARAILSELALPFHCDGQDVFLTASIGISLYTLETQDVEIMLANADIALGRAKDRGKNNFQFFTQEMGKKVQNLKEKERYLCQALQRNELFLCYQPKVDIINNRILGMEALLRWQSTELGLIPPGHFIPLAEKLGLIASIGNWVFYTACRQAKQWLNSAARMRIAVNLSARQFQGTQSISPRLMIKSIEAALSEADFPPELLEIEITESVLMKNYQSAMVVFKTLKDLGVRISCDDFGKGYSSLNYIKRFPIDTIKIDKSFVKNIATDPVDIAIIRAIIVMAKQLNIEVVGEGVETEEQLNMLRELECGIVQGYYFSRPVIADEATALIQNIASSFPRTGRYPK